MKPREYNPRATLISALVVGGLIVWSYFMRPPEIPLLQLQGETMGTYYIVKATESGMTKNEAQAFKAELDQRLDEINQQMSTWLPDSEISRFNASAVETPTVISKDFQKVMQQALNVSQTTEGAFDPTIQPLLRLWGFGSEGNPSSQNPDPATLEKIKGHTGIQHLSLNQAQLSKTAEGLELDLGAIAKGYAVDVFVEILHAKGITNCFVDIGGEVRCSGRNPKGVAWRIGIQQPTVDSTHGNMNALQSVIALDHRAVATSGNYRSYREREDGSRYGHLLDPRSASPVESNVASVTVVAKSCVYADALATGFFVLGPKKALSITEQLEGVETLFLIWGATGELEAQSSSGFDKLKPSKES